MCCFVDVKFAFFRGFGEEKAMSGLFLGEFEVGRPKL